MDLTQDGEEHKMLSMDEILELGDECLGLKVIVYSREESYTGVINYVLPSSRRMALEKVCDPKTGKRMLGLRHFFFQDILNVAVINEDKESRQRLMKDVYQEDQRGKQLLMKKLVPPHLASRYQEACQVDEDVLLGRVGHNRPTNEYRKGDSKSQEESPPPPPPARVQRPEKWIIIASVDDAFNKAATEVYLYMVNRKGSVPSFVSGLPSLLIRYLKLSSHHVFFSHVREECAQSDESVWFERPLPVSLCEGLSRSVMYLRELRLVLLKLMLVDLAQVTNLYLGSMRDKDSATASILEPQIVPAEVQKLGRRSTNNTVDVHDPYITYSRDAFKILMHRK